MKDRLNDRNMPLPHTANDTTDTRQRRVPRRRPYSHSLAVCAVSLACLLQSSRALAPSSAPRSKISQPRAQPSSLLPLVSEFTVPVEWEGDTLSPRERKRQYTPKASSRTTTALHMGTTSSPSDTNHEFDLHVGRALDILRDDYPSLLTELPNLSIYDANLEVVDPSGVTVHGLKTYQNSFRILHALVKFLYCPSRSTMTFRMCYDKARRNIRIHWNAAVVPREMFGGSRKTLHVDGISVYEMDFETGQIVQHRIEKLLINSMPIRPKEGVIAALDQQHRVTVPSFIQGSSQSGDISNMLRFQKAGLLAGRSPTSLFAMEASEEKSAKAPNDASTAGSAYSVDQERFDAKNRSRKNFGLKPMTEEEFLQVESQVRVMEAEHEQRAAAVKQAAASEASKPEQAPGFMEKLFGNVMKDTCESNYDCERPQVCCDFGFKKMCCSSGSMVASGVQQLTLVPVPVDINPTPPHPQPRNF
jgi:hypothetical protein